MKTKIVVLNDFTVRKTSEMERWKDLEKEYDCEVQIVEDRPEVDNSEKFNEMFLKLEQEGPDALPINEELVNVATDADIIISHISPIPGKVIDCAEKLKAVCIMRSGVENVNVAHATAKGVKVINAPGRLSVPVAEYTVGLMISEMKNIARSYHLMKGGEFKTSGYANSAYSVNLKGKTVGIIGCGAVGKRVANVMKAFEANVIAYDPYADADQLAADKIEAVELNELCKRSDVISVHYRLTKDTEKMIGKEQIALMKPTCFLINTARAGLVDEEALIEALRKKKIGGAGIDVYMQEPLPLAHPFYQMDNVTITPHLAGTCSNVFEITFGIMEEAIRHYLETGEWIHVVK